MDYQDVDEKEYERRKKEAVEYRNKKRFSNIFMVLASLFEIIETFIIVAALIVAFLAIITRVMDLNASKAGSVVYTAGMIIVFIGGMILGFMVYKKTVIWVIKKFKLEEKLLDDVLDHYKTKEEKAKAREEKLTK